MTVNTDTVEKRPAIIVTRNPFQYSNLALDNLLSHDLSTDTRKHTDLIQGSFTINCVSRFGLEAEDLALFVAKAIKMYRRDLQMYGFFQIGQSVQIGAETNANQFVSGDSDEDFIFVPVTFPVFYQETWSIKPKNAKLLSKIEVIINTIFRRTNGTLVYPDSIIDGTVNANSKGVVVSQWTITSSS